MYTISVQSTYTFATVDIVFKLQSVNNSDDVHTWSTKRIGKPFEQITTWSKLNRSTQTHTHTLNIRHKHIVDDGHERMLHVSNNIFILGTEKPVCAVTKEAASTHMTHIVLYQIHYCFHLHRYPSKYNYSINFFVALVRSFWNDTNNKSAWYLYQLRASWQFITPHQAMACV